MTRKIAIGAAVLVALLAAVVALQPAEFAIERSEHIAAPPEVVYPHIASLRAMDAWSPWVKMDQRIQIAHEGPESGVGAIEAWTGPHTGTGRMTITSARPNQEVEIALEFFEPMPSRNLARFTLAPEDGGTRVTWRMEGTNTFVGKAASLVMNMEQMIGGNFERGLADLKKLAETGSRPVALRGTLA
jgi:uncharacterized protein YndB with AHSA1/START domain